jgi:asparagine synthase (glutamine-hydrolysing)
MCGIVGIVSHDGPVVADVLACATQRLHHRGPDHQGTWIAPGGESGLGSARLSIVDLVCGDQPLANEDGTLHAVVNGELYDFERIRRGLIERGHQFRTGSDSEIVLHLYEDHGPDCLRHLRGEFALLLWDQTRRRLFAARDRFGIKPLYWTEHAGRVLFASEAKALFAAGVPAAWDEESFFQQLFIYPAPDRTLFAGVRQVPPGHYLLADAQGVRCTRYWDLDYPLAAPQQHGGRNGGGDTEHVERMRTALDEAVRLRLRADVPVGCFLSGGVDSSAVIGLAAPHCPDPIRAFTVVFDDSSYDEGEIARETAARAGADFHPIPLDHADFADHLSDAVWHAETLGINPHGVARFLQSRAVRAAGYKVVLSGEGSDEILAGYAHARQDAQLARAGQAGSAPPRGLAAVHEALGFVPYWLKRLAINRSVFHALLAPGFAARCAGRDPYRTFMAGFDRGQLAGREPLFQSLYLWTRSILPNYILFAERLEMAHSIESRLPFLDHHLVEAVVQMPVSVLLRGLTEKYVLREAAKSVLTPTVYARHKHPFTAPPSKKKDRMHEMMQEVLRGPALDAVPFFDRTAVAALLDQLPALDEGARIGLDAALLMILCTCILQRRYGL